MWGQKSVFSWGRGPKLGVPDPKKKKKKTGGPQIGGAFFFLFFFFLDCNKLGGFFSISRGGDLRKGGRLGALVWGGEPPVGGKGFPILWGGFFFNFFFFSLPPPGGFPPTPRLGPIFFLNIHGPQTPFFFFHKNSPLKLFPRNFHTPSLLKTKATIFKKTLQISNVKFLWPKNGPKGTFFFLLFFFSFPFLFKIFFPPWIKNKVF